MEYLSVIIVAGLLVSVVYLAQQCRQSKSSPPTVPSRIPWLGNAMEFDRNPHQFLEMCRRRYGSIFKTLIAGTKFVIVSDMDVVLAVERNASKSLSGEQFKTKITGLLSALNTEKDKEFVYKVARDKLIPAVARGFSPNGLASGVGDVFDSEVRNQLKALGDPRRPTRLNLSYLISHPLYTATSTMLFGTTFPMDEDTFEDLELVDRKVPDLLSGVPFVARDALRARDRLLAKTMHYLSPFWKTNSFDKMEGISSIIIEGLQEMKAAGCNEQQASGALICALYASLTNSQFMLFWLFAYLSVDQTAMERIRAEIDANAPSPGDNKGGIFNGSGTPLLNSAIDEAMRWAAVGSVVRVATKDTELCVKGIPSLVRKNEWVLPDIKGIHFDASIYSEPTTFQIDRYLDPQTAPPKPMVWGGGSTICKGKHFALFEMRRFATHCIQLYDMKPVTAHGEKAKLPGMKKSRVIGILGDVEDICVEISPRFVQ